MNEATIDRIDRRTSRLENAFFGVETPDGIRSGGVLDRLARLEKLALAIMLLILGSMAGAVATAAIGSFFR